MKKIIAIIFLAVGLYLGYSLYPTVNKAAPSPSSQQATSTVSLLIEKGGGNELVLPRVSLAEGESLFSVLDRATRANNVEFSYKDYGGSMGAFITSIASSTNSSDKWWQYWVNGKYANVGVSSYKPEAGDVIEFRLTNEIN